MALNRVMSTPGEGDTHGRAIDEALKIQDELATKVLEMEDLGFSKPQAEYALRKHGGSMEVCGMVWCGVVRCGAVRCGAVWCGVVPTQR